MKERFTLVLTHEQIQMLHISVCRGQQALRKENENWSGYSTEHRQSLIKSAEILESMRVMIMDEIYGKGWTE